MLLRTEHGIDGRTLYDDVEKALKGGVTLLQLREKKYVNQTIL